jgi:hypothetical protein
MRTIIKSKINQDPLMMNIISINKTENKTLSIGDVFSVNVMQQLNQV